MNKIFRGVWSCVLSTWVVASELAHSAGRPRREACREGHLRRRPRGAPGKALPRAAVAGLPVALMVLGLPVSAAAQALSGIAPPSTSVSAAPAAPPPPTANLPAGGEIVAGQGNIGQSGNTLTVQQSSEQLIADWQSFDIGEGYSVSFMQPGRDAIALNRVLGNDPSRIYGALNANGRVFLVNANGVLFAESAQFDVGGLVASTLDISNEDFLAGRYTFRGDGDNASVVNHGSIIGDAGVVALLGGAVTNHGLIQANLGSVALAAGNQVTVDFAGDGLLQLTVDEAALDALAENHELIRADGGSVLLSARGTDALLETVVNNTGAIEARSLAERHGRILLLGGFEGGTVNVGGALDASALPAGAASPPLPFAGDGQGEGPANGGFIETSGAHVQVAAGARVTTLGANGGDAGAWLIDPTDFTVNAGAAAQTSSGIGADTLAANLATTSVELQTVADGSEPGDIYVDAAVAWNAATTLTLTAHNDVYINAPITVEHAGGGLALNHGGDYYVRSPVSFTAGSGGSFSVNGDSYTLILDVHQLQAMENNLAGRYALGNDIDASATAGWNSGAGFAPIGDGGSSQQFTGAFDGLGHVISDLTINRGGQNYVGLFEINVGTLRNIGLAEASISGWDAVGALAGSNEGSISNSYASGAVTGHGIGTGGLVGWNLGGSINDAWFAGAVAGNDLVGGLVGWNGRSGIVPLPGDIARAYATATVTGNANIGGLVGRHELGSISDSFHTGPDNGLGAARTLAELQQLSTFAVWGADIDSEGGTGAVWRIYEGHTTPLLRAFLRPLTVTMDGAAGKTYDGSIGSGTLDASQYTLSDPTATVQGSLFFATIGDDAGEYSVSSGSLSLDGLYSDQQGYDITYADDSLYTIARKALAITGVVAQDKEYDGAVAATVSGGALDGVVATDDVGLVLGTAQFADKNAGVGKTVNVSGSLSGSDAGNYALTANSTTTADITPKAITGSITADDKLYDGTTVATVTGALTGVIAGDDIDLAASGAFADKNAGAGKTVNVSGSLSGSDAGNYALTANSTTTADITPRALVLNASSDRRTYDGTTASSAEVGVDGLVAGDTITALSQSFDSRNAGQRTLAVDEGYILNDGTAAATTR